MTWLYIFLALAVLDFIWGKYIAAVSGASAVVAAAWAVPIYALGSWVTIEYVHDPVLLIPACSGAFVGTWLSVKVKNRTNCGVAQPGRAAASYAEGREFESHPSQPLKRNGSWRDFC